MKQAVETTEVSLADLSLEAAVEDLKTPTKGLDSSGPRTLPGLLITKYVLHNIHEPAFQSMAEPYLYGIAVDSRLTPMKIPLLDIDATKFALPRVGAEAKVTFGDRDGEPLVLPPVEDFLALVLFVADSDNAKGTAEVLKAVSDLVTNADIIKVAAGVNPTAAALLEVMGGVLNVVVKGIEANRDDIIAAFSSYYGPSRLVPGNKLRLSQPGCDVSLKVMSE